MRIFNGLSYLCGKRKEKRLDSITPDPPETVPDEENTYTASVSCGGTFKNTYSRGSGLTTKSPWMQSQAGRPNRLILIRHGESQGNVDRTITQRVPDHAIHLTKKGRHTAVEAGIILKDLLGDESVRFIVSPYVRTRETFNGISRAFGGPAAVTFIEDPRIREIEYGNFDRADIKKLHDEKKQFGAFFYRFPEGESPADVYDRASAFMETLYRMWQTKREENYVVVGHGVALLVFLMRFLGMTIEEFYNLAPLDNVELVVLERNDMLWYDKHFSLRAGHEKHVGLRQKKVEQQREDLWDGSGDGTEDMPWDLLLGS